MTTTKESPVEELVDHSPQTQHLVHTPCLREALLDPMIVSVIAYCGHVLSKSPGPDVATLKCPICMDLMGTVMKCPNCGQTVLVFG